MVVRRRDCVKVGGRASQGCAVQTPGLLHYHVGCNGFCIFCGQHWGCTRPIRIKNHFCWGSISSVVTGSPACHNSTLLLLMYNCSSCCLEKLYDVPSLEELDALGALERAYGLADETLAAFNEVAFKNVVINTRLQRKAWSWRCSSYSIHFIFRGCVSLLIWAYAIEINSSVGHISKNLFLFHILSWDFHVSYSYAPDWLLTQS